MKNNTGARWEITVDGKPRIYDHKRELAIEAAQYLKLKNPNADVTVRDLGRHRGNIIIPAQQPRVRR
jgi:predicted Rdx family selenoprotein